MDMRQGVGARGLLMVLMVCLCGNILDGGGIVFLLTLRSFWVVVRASVSGWTFGVGRLRSAGPFRCFSVLLRVKRLRMLITCVGRMGFLIGMSVLLGCYIIGKWNLSRICLAYYTL